ncbi:uncharacterized protein DUF2508 [Lachnotalea glycerini]|uniref:Uncharacterized protein DUF2508 n=2 Tax=Lachnotalea glycerini TaxID=1763509 RepID=A0A318EYF2_9FIRM|nr:DUF2508 family protein [Lachnotalea glycerini]PXV91832.1 uncharacterized protein DUF2508 [Lachnotalea glycerini]
MIKDFFSNMKMLPAIKDESVSLKIYRNKEHLDLLSDLAKIQNDLDIAYSNFENVVDPDLIDSCIYELNAVQKKYKFLYERVKEHEFENYT